MQAKTDRFLMHSDRLSIMLMRGQGFHPCTQEKKVKARSLSSRQTPFFDNFKKEKEPSLHIKTFFRLVENLTEVRCSTPTAGHPPRFPRWVYIRI